MNKHGLDGTLDTINLKDLDVGHVLRMVQSDPNVVSTFSDCAVLSIDLKHEVVKLGRCYCFVSSTGQPLLGCEQFSVGFESLQRNFRTVLMSTGSPANFSL